MTLPRISVGTFMVGLCVVALDCVVFRSFGARYNGLHGFLFLAILATLPMANILAFATARLLGGWSLRTAGLVGFVVGGAVAMLATVLGLEPALNQVERALNGSPLARWIEASPYGEPVALVVIIGLPPFLFQAVAALACGAIGRKLAKAPVAADATPTRPSRPLFRVTIAALLLAAIPAVVVEATLRTKVDRHLTRFAVGSEATFDLDRSAMADFVPKGSPIRELVGHKVRVVEDTESNMVEHVVIGDRQFIRDRRYVKVTVLDGPRAGEATAVPHCCLWVQP